MTRLYLALQRELELRNAVARRPSAVSPPIRPVRTRVIEQSALPAGAFMLSDSWGQYRVSKTRSAVGSIFAHALIIGGVAALSLVPHQVQVQSKPVESVTLIAPPP